ncbi:MAG TPA: ATP-binding protein [Verrucomicrobiae bacterium]|nr:ATP-binding protein [Verrucomicrobiae bacterium]
MKFRLKIALLSLLISGAVMVGFGICFLRVIERVQIDRVDREISALCDVPLRRWVPGEFWKDFGKSLQIIYGDASSNQVVACVWDTDKNALYKAPQCPKEIAEMTLPPMQFAQPQPPEPARLDGMGMGPPPFDDAPTNDFSNRRLPRDQRWMSPRRSPGSDDPGMMPRWPDEPGGMPGPPGGPRLPMPRSTRMKTPIFRTVQTSAGDWRVGILGNDSVTVVIGANLVEYHREAARVRNAFLVAAPLGLLALAAGGWLLATRVLRPITVITRTAAGITARDLGQRIPATSADPDLGQLVDVINSMLDRLEKSFHQAVRFSADAAHELQTPLTVLQGELEAAIQRAPMGSDNQQWFGDLLEEVQRLKAIMQKLLLLARADAGQLTLSLEPVDLSAVVEDSIEDVRAIAPHLRVEERIASDIRVLADADLLAQAIRNMTSNAVKYNIENGSVCFDLQSTGEVARLTLSNTGAPIPEKDRERIFDRFYRVDESRNRRVGGAGLGLSLAREIARAHRGDLVLNRSTDDLISFTLTVPLANKAGPTHAADPSV